MWNKELPESVKLGEYSEYDNISHPTSKNVWWVVKSVCSFSIFIRIYNLTPLQLMSFGYFWLIDSLKTIQQLTKHIQYD